MLLESSRSVSFRGLHPVQLDVEARDGAARAGVATHGTRLLPHAVLHARRHPRRGQVPERRRLRRARRGDRARQHVPPDAAAGRRCRRPLRRARRVRRLGRTDADRLRRLPGLLARPAGRRRRRDVPQHLRRIDCTASRRSRPWPPRSCSVPTSRWCSTCARRCRARPTSSARRRANGRLGRARPRRPPTATDQSLFGIVQGGTDESLRSRERAAHRRARLRRLRHRRALGRRDRARRCCRRSPRPSTHLPDRPPALPHGRRRPGVPRRGRRRSASTSSTA